MLANSLKETVSISKHYYREDLYPQPLLSLRIIFVQCWKWAWPQKCSQESAKSPPLHLVFWGRTWGLCFDVAYARKLAISEAAIEIAAPFNQSPFPSSPCSPLVSTISPTHCSVRIATSDKVHCLAPTWKRWVEERKVEKLLHAALPCGMAKQRSRSIVVLQARAWDNFLINQEFEIKKGFLAGKIIIRVPKVLFYSETSLNFGILLYFLVNRTCINLLKQFFKLSRSL